MKRLILFVVVAVLVPAAHGAKRGGEAVALVTAETRNQLLVVDLSDGDVLERLKMPAGPENVETTPDDDAAVVVSPRAGAVTLLALPHLRVRRTIRGFGSPHIAAFSPDGEFVYVTDDTRGELVVIGLARARIVGRTFVGYGAHHMSFRPHHRELWIALGERARTVAVVDTTRPARPKRIGRFSPGGIVHDLGFAPDGRRLWMTYADRSTVTVFDVRLRRRTARLRAGTPPQHVAFGRRVFVTSGVDGRLRIFSFDGRLRTVAHTPSGSYNIGLGGGVVLTSSLSRGTVTLFRGNGRLLWTRKVAPAARDAAFAVLP